MPWREDKVISVNQLSLHGAVADLIKAVPDDQRAPGKLVALDQMEQEILSQPPLAEVQANEERQGNLLQNCERRFETLPKLCSEASLNLVEVRQFSLLFRNRIGRKINLYDENTRYLEMKRKIVQKGGSKSDARFGPVSDIKVCKTHGRYSVEDQTTSWIRIVNGVEKSVREAMPIQEGERASGKPAAEARPILKPSSRSN